MCDWKPDFDMLNKRVDGIESRMSQVEHDVGKMRTTKHEIDNAAALAKANAPAPQEGAKT